MNTRWLRALSAFSKYSPLLRASSDFARGLQAPTRLERGTAVASFLGSIGDTFVSGYSPDTTLRHCGFRMIPGQLGVFLGDAIRASDWESENISNGAGRGGFVFWIPPGYSEPPIATISRSDFGSSLEVYVREGLCLDAVFRDLFWKIGSSVFVETNIRGYEIRYQMRPMNPPGEYVGTPTPDWIASRISNSPDVNRSILLVGPSGAGKSTLARLVALQLAGPDARTLKVAGSVLRTATADALLDMVTLLQPTVLLLDDLPLGTSTSESLLAMFEALRGRTRLIISTYMDDTLEPRTNPGSNYWPGMRPGRIDDVIRIPRPDAPLRAQILQLYFAEFGGAQVSPEEVAAECEGLTGAYLREVAVRLCGVSPLVWQEEVKLIRLMAPCGAGGVSAAPTAAILGASPTPKFG